MFSESPRTPLHSKGEISVRFHGYQKNSKRIWGRQARCCRDFARLKPQVKPNSSSSSILGARQAEMWFVYHFLTFTDCNGFWICIRVFNPCDTAKSIKTPRILFGIDSYPQFLPSLYFWCTNLMGFIGCHQIKDVKKHLNNVVLRLFHSTVKIFLLWPQLECINLIYISELSDVDLLSWIFCFKFFYLKI